VRYACTWQAFCHRPDHSWWRWAQVHDVSGTGVLLRTNQPFEKGSLLDLEIEVCGFIIPVWVQHVKEEPDGYWLLGCEFADGLSVPEEDLQRVLRRFAQQ